MKVLASCFVAAALALAFAPAARAEVWAYVDEKGVPHFASERLDERYELFFRGGENPGGSARADVPRAVAVPTAPPKLIAFFEVSPHYKQVQHHLRAASRAHGVDFELLKAVIATESGFDTTALSPRGAVGLMQVMPATAQRFGIKGDAKAPVEKKLFDPAVNIKAGTLYLRYLLDRFPGQLEVALAAYNAGEGAVRRAGQQVPDFRETQNYVKTVMQLYAMLKPPAAIGGGGNVPGRVHLKFPGVAAVPAPPVAVAAPNYDNAPFE